MQQFQDLEIAGDTSRFDAFDQELSAAVAPPWSARPAANQSLLGKGVKATLFDIQPTGANPGATVVWIRDEKKARYSVPNIIPNQQANANLTFDQYNSILQEFKRFVTPIAARHGLSVDLTDSRFNIADHLSPESVRRLHGFSNAANKSTGSGHPMDRQRWFDFVIQTHRDGCDASPVLGRYLVEGLGWGEGIAFDLVCEYEIALCVLERYDTQRQ